MDGICSIFFARFRDAAARDGGVARRCPAAFIMLALLIPAQSALVVRAHTRAGLVAKWRAPPPRADFGSFEKSFNNELYKEERLEKNGILSDLILELPNVANGFKADGLALRQGIDDAREAGATVVELKRYIDALKKADPSLITEVDEAVLLGVEQRNLAAQPQKSRPPPDTFLTDEQFEA